MARIIFHGAMGFVGCSASLVDTGVEKILLDYGTKIQEMAPKFPLPVGEKLNATILSHCHLDHCIHKDTLVQCGDGRILKIKDMFEDNINSVIAYDLDKSLSQQKVDCDKKIIKSPPTLLKIRTETKEIKTTKEHRFFVLDGLNIKEKYAYELKENDFIASVKRLDFKGVTQTLPKVNVRGTYKIKSPEKTNKEICQILGYLLGDGDAYKSKKIYSNRKIRATDKDKKLLEFYKKLIKATFNISSSIRKRKDANSYKLIISSPLFYDLIFSISDKILCRPPSRKIPEIIHRVPKEQLAKFLRGLFDAEGSVTGHKIALTSKSYDIIQIAQILLLRFGIISHIYSQKEGKNPTIPTYQLTIYYTESIKNFYKNIGFTSQTKKYLLEELVNFSGGGIERIDIIPIGGNDIIDIIETLGLKKTDLRKFGINYTHYFKHYPSRKKLKEFIKKLEIDNKEVRKLRKILNSEILWERIKKISEVDSDSKYVYDLSVAGHHNYIANGIIVHNSGALPILHAKGNHSPIFSVDVTKPLTELLLLDSIKVSREEGVELPFTKHDVTRTIESFIPMKYRQPLQLKETEITFYDAGHIPGSCMPLLDFNGKTLLYTGDFKTTDTRLLKKADTNLPEVNILVTETTYADRDHPDRKSQEKELVGIISDTLAVDGVCLIAGFGVGRLDEILLVLNAYGIDYPVYLDGMAKKVITIINQHKNLLREPNSLDKVLEKVEYVSKESMRRKIIRQPCVILTTSGMLSGGPIVGYIKKLHDKIDCSLILTGFQVEGTPGKILLETGKFITDDFNLDVKMFVRKLDFSSHLGRTELLKFIEKVNPEKVFCVHGDHTEEFAQELRGKGFDAVAPLANNRIFNIY